MQNELHDWEMRKLIHAATRTNDPSARASLARFVGWFLISDQPLRRPVREWLSWVLNDLARRDQVPHQARGNAIKTDETVAFTRRLVEVMEALPPGKITKRLRDAAKQLGVSYEKARSTYYSDSYKAWLWYMNATAEIPTNHSPNK